MISRSSNLAFLSDCWLPLLSEIDHAIRMHFHGQRCFADQRIKVLT